MGLEVWRCRVYQEQPIVASVSLAGKRLSDLFDEVVITSASLSVAAAGENRSGSAPVGPQRLQRAKMAVGSSSPRVSSRTASSPHSTFPGRSANNCASSSPIASADMRTA